MSSVHRRFRIGSGIYKLGGRVYVDRVPVAARLTRHPEEEDYPSLAAGANGDMWLAYVQFHHSPDADKLRASPPKTPKDFKLYAEPTGGDQIWARKYSGGKMGERHCRHPGGRRLLQSGGCRGRQRASVGGLVGEPRG